MAVLASDVMDKAATLLNDAAKVTFGYTILLGKLQIAWEDLQNKLAEHGASIIKHKTSSAISIAAHAKDVTSYPADFLSPIDLYERAVGATDDDWTPMSEQDFLPNRTESDQLQDWSWNGDEINFVGCTENREIKMDYLGQIAAITSENSAIPVTGSLNFLAYRTAAIQAAILKNDLAGSLASEAGAALQTFLNTRAKQRQGLPVRRKPYRYGVMLRRKRRF